MLFRLVVLLLISFSAASALARELHVAFDLDGTLIQPMTEEFRDTNSDQVIKYNDETYRLNDFAPEVLEKLVKAGYKISFFSAGSRERNHAVIEHLRKLVSERSGLKLEPHKVLNFENLTPVFAPENARFRDRYRKDVQNIADVEDVVLVDDIKEFMLPGEERNLLHIPTEIKTVRERQKLLVVMEILLQARELVRNGNAAYLPAVRGLAFETAPDANDNGEAYDDLMTKALRRFHLNARLGEPAYPKLSITRTCRSIFN